jgi:energy-coupling factor transport system permease protein
MSVARRAIVARDLHPVAWWLWATAIAVAAMQTTNPLLLALLASTVLLVAAARRSARASARSLTMFIRLGLFVIALRVALQVLFGDRLPGHVLFTLPSVPLPSWAEGVSIGGPVTAESILLAATEGLRLAVVLLAFGAANVLASPFRLLKCLPSILYESGVVVTVALSYVPQLAATIEDIRTMRRLRGRPVRGVAGLRGMAVPVLEGALDRSVHLAASMDARGYGRRVEANRSRRIVSRTLILVGMVACLLGLYLVTGTSSNGSGLAYVALGVCGALAGVVLGGVRARRSTYRPDPWRGPEWVVTGSAIALVAAFAVASAAGAPGLHVDYSPLAWPTVPLLCVIGIACSAIPAIATPPPASSQAGVAAALPALETV